MTKGDIVGTSIIAAQYGLKIYEQHFGFANRETDQRVNKKSQFRLASMTKPITSAATLVLAEKGIIPSLDTPITYWLPTFQPKLANGDLGKITVRQLLNHTAGFHYSFLKEHNEPYHSAGVSDGLDASVLSLEENLQRLSKVPLLFKPGTDWHYSIATDVLGAVLEKACQQPLPLIIKTHVTQPLGMHDTSFNETPSLRLTQAYTQGEFDQPARLMLANDQVRFANRGMVRYHPSRIGNPNTYPSGGAGMISTAEDYWLFMEMLQGNRLSILSKESLNLLTQDSIGDFASVPA